MTICTNKKTERTKYSNTFEETMSPKNPDLGITRTGTMCIFSAASNSINAAAPPF